MYKTREVKQYRRIKIAVICDNCGKEHEGSEQPKDWHSFSAHHDEWGSDTIDSYENFNVCSTKCYIEKLTKVVKELSPYDSGKIDGMTIQFAEKLVIEIQKKD